MALYTGNKIPFLFAQLGVLYAGACPLPLNPRFTREEMRYFLSDSEARMVIAGAEELPLVAALAPDLRRPPLAQADVDDGTPGSFREPNVAADDPRMILYSSGTTGWPKGVVHTHAGTAGSLRALQACWQLSADDVVLNVLPLYHIHGLEFATHLTWLAGGCIRIEESFDVSRTLAAIGDSTVFMAVPAIYYRLLESAEFRTAAASWSRTRLFTCGSAPIRPEVLPELEEILRHPVINRYGMSESYVITSLPLDRAVAARLGGPAAARDGAENCPQRRLACRAGRSGQRAHPRSEFVSRILAQAGRDAGRLSRRLVRHGRFGLARRAPASSRWPAARRT